MRFGRGATVNVQRDYYEVLGVAKTATEVEHEIRLPEARDEVPSGPQPRRQDAEVKFKELNEAYQALSDAQKRAAYDRFGHAAFANGGARRAGLRQRFLRLHVGHLRELLRRDPGGAAGRAAGGRERGADMRYNLEITLEEAFKGKTAELKIPTAITCEVLLRHAAPSPAPSPRTCPTCGGAGRVRATQGFFSIERTCPNCHGRGEVIDDPCADCGGAGRVTRERTLSVNIPAGRRGRHAHSPGRRGRGGPRGGPAGDLYIFLSLKAHPFFQRDGADLFCRVPISMVTAALGGEFERADDRRLRAR